jgi:anhydro-N-acetylmuramic acid kinase
VNKPPAELYIGLMSGTSQDAIDGVLAEFDATGRNHRLLAVHRLPLAEALRRRLDQLQAGDGDLELAVALHHELGERFADCAVQLLPAAGENPVKAIGSHGQTVRHAPNSAAPHSLQLGNAARIAARCGVAVVADFRNSDIAVGGQGAPLAPAFHQAAFGGAGTRRAVLNLGGMANVSLLNPGDTAIRGWDTGPGNVLLDGWAQRHLGRPYDDDGNLARRGRVHEAFLDALLAHPFITRPPPKSTGRDTFNLAWVDALLAGLAPLPAADVQATLAEFTAASVAINLQAHRTVQELLVCGGGVFNGDLMARIARRLPWLAVRSTAEAGVDPQHVEALAFAWLARQRMHEQALDLRTVTGAQRPAVLGCVYLP